MRLLSVMLLLVLLLPLTPAAAAEYQVINGQPATEGEYPAMAAVLVNGFGQFCGGTLIHAEWVMTAAHCFYDSRTGGSNIPPADLEIVLDSTAWQTGGERLRVDAIAIHPDYDEFRTVNDIAMLHLSTPAVTPPAPLPADPALYTPGDIAVVTGWGATDPYGQSPSTVLLETTVPLVGDADCAVAYDIVPDRHTCAGDPGTEDAPGNDTCQGDSGGPMWVDRGDGVLAVIGITSFGNLCGVQTPGVYTEVITYLDYIAGIIDGSIAPDTPVDPTTPDLPSGAAADPFRVTFDATGVSDPVLQAVAISQTVFLDGSADYGVVATSTRFPDALGGATLAYGVAPLLFTRGDGTIGPETLTELRRVVNPGSPIYVLGGPAAVPESVDSQLSDVGFVVVRLAGPGREATAAVVAQEVLAQQGALPLDTVIVATGANWPDAVTVGQIGAWWGVPVLLTPTDSLDADTAAALSSLAPSTVLISGGTSAISDGVVAQVEAITGPGSALRLGGDTRFGTAAAVTAYHLSLFGAFSPDYIIAVNLQREPDAYAHVLAASMLAGGFRGVFVAVEGETVPADVLNSVCGLDLPVLVAGDVDLVSDQTVLAVQAASGGQGCVADNSIALGEVTFSSITPALPVRSYVFSGSAGQQVRIRMDALPSEEFVVDPILELYGPDGALIAFNDDAEEPGGRLNSLLLATLPSDGAYRIDATSFGQTTGGFILSLDPAPVVQRSGVIDPGTIESVVLASPPEGTQIIVEMRSVDGFADPLLVAYDADGTEIAFDDDGGGFPNARMALEMPANGPVEIVATVFGDSYGEFILAVSEVNGPGDPANYSG